MIRRVTWLVLAGMLGGITLQAAEDASTSVMKSATQGGKISETEKSLYEQSIKTTKQSIARETLQSFYEDALSLYEQKRYEEALAQLEIIVSKDPSYEDARRLRDRILKSRSRQTESTNQGSIRELMRKGDKARHEGERIRAVNFWKEALKVDPQYAPARKKIQEVNAELAQSQFKAFYLYYNNQDWENALDAGSNAITLDPTLKQRGLLALMAKVEKNFRQDQVNKLATQAFDQYQQGDLEAALQSYEALSRLNPRHEEARRMAGKIKIQLGQAALKSAQRALAAGDWAQAGAMADQAIQHRYEVQKAEAIKREAAMHADQAKKPRAAKPVSKTKRAAPATVDAAPPPPPTPQVVDREKALEFYRAGMSAIRNKDYHLALDKLEEAAKYDATDERIYMARERARQELQNTRTTP